MDPLSRMTRFTLQFLISLHAVAAIAADELKAFPMADAGMTRHVLRLEPKEDEMLFKVEILIGKTVAVDAVNRFFFGGKIEAVNIEGWGYTRYVVKELGPMAGTMMAAPPGAENVRRFVSLGGEPYLVRYNSKLPLVVYVPEGAEVRTRLWRTDSAALSVDEG